MTSSLATWLLLAVAASPVDQILETTWREKGVEPASVCTDEEFLRRIMLDLVGRIPSLDEVRSFQANPDRAGKVDELGAVAKLREFRDQTGVLQDLPALAEQAERPALMVIGEVVKLRDELAWFAGQNI